MSGVYWGLTSMFLMNKQDMMEKDEIIEFVKSCQHDQGCALAAPGRLRRPTFGFGRPKNKTGRPTGHPAVLCAVQHCRKACD